MTLILHHYFKRTECFLLTTLYGNRGIPACSSVPISRIHQTCQWLLKLYLPIKDILGQRIMVSPGDYDYMV